MYLKGTIVAFELMMQETPYPRYKLLSDYDKRNAFDIEKYRQHKLVVKPTETFDLYDMGEIEAE